MTGLPAPEDVQAAFASVLVDEWLRAGVTDAVVCPGSRSTPLLVALSEAAERGRSPAPRAGGRALGRLFRPRAGPGPRECLRRW